ncbi:HK97 family phage prohead protease [Acinetobacter sp. FL51]|uniref:HK97 family phage prohead protease n=1 Tax=Acinetobacter sp. FL51 TaxID=2777978 RepID=UPI0018E10734|nr:HK97 family phage prohead protease [Acinetobacter sp. FL51]MBI1450337.1 HK97 family phage prohead protease [Acinetobacter sp. FL51]
MGALFKNFSSFEIKSFDESTRTFTGTASTSNPDRVKDIMVPSGVQFTLPVPLLLHHDSKLVVGYVTKITVLENTIEVEFYIPEIKEEGKLKERVDEAFQSVQYKLITGLSVGFNADWESAEFIQGGGIKFNKWELIELSLVTTPCNREAGVDYAKAFEEYKAALGKEPQQPAPDGDSSEQKHIVVKLNCPTKGGVKL